MIIGTIIQARLGSTRFPRKILEEINGRSVLEHVVERIYKAKNHGVVIIACPENPTVCLNEHIYIGDESDVLKRYFECAVGYSLDIITRITADCPLLAPFEIDRCVDRILQRDTHYVTNVGKEGRFGVPDGWDVECFTFHALQKAHKESTEREHVTTYMKSDATLNPIILEPPKLSLDDASDLERIRNWYELEK